MKERITPISQGLRGEIGQRRSQQRRQSLPQMDHLLIRPPLRAAHHSRQYFRRASMLMLVFRGNEPAEMRQKDGQESVLEMAEHDAEDPIIERVKLPMLLHVFYGEKTDQSIHVCVLRHFVVDDALQGSQASGHFRDRHLLVDRGRDLNQSINQSINR